MGNGRIARVTTSSGVKYYDLGTKNKSFLKVARDLKILGIKNYYWMLEIKDPAVLKIDPYASDDEGHTTLSEDQISRVILECRKNPWYFLREVVRIPDEGGTSKPYRANRGNLAQSWCITKWLDSWLCLPRRTNLLPQNRVTCWTNSSNCGDILFKVFFTKLYQR